LHSQVDPDEEDHEEEEEEGDPNNGKIMIPAALDKILKSAKVTIPEIMTFVHGADMPANAAAVSTDSDTVACPHRSPREREREGEAPSPSPLPSPSPSP